MSSGSATDMDNGYFYAKTTGLFVGRGGIRAMTVDGNEEIELGYALMPAYWGRGLATEIGKKALSIAFEQFHYPSVVCFTLVDNKRSERVMQKIGFAFEGQILHAGLPPASATSSGVPIA